jgi:hypothetical protein
MKIGIVCGYGIISDERLHRYLHAVSTYATEQHIELLILSGGYTVKGAKRTEARVMREVIQQETSGFQIILEEESISTLHNLVYSKQILGQFCIPGDHLYIFCDYVRFMKVTCLAKILFKEYAVRVVKFERKEPLFIYMLQIPFTVLQCLGALFPAIEKKIMQCRRYWMEKWG